MFRFPRKGTRDAEVSLADVIYFLRLNFKFFGLSALGLSVIAVALVLLIPKQYEKQISLSVQQISSQVSSGLSAGVRRVEPVSNDTLGKQAVRYVQEGDFGNVNVSPRYDDVEQKVELTLSSRDPEALDGISSEVIDLLKAKFQKSFENRLVPALEGRLNELERSMEYHEAAMARIEQQIEQASTGASRAGDANATARLQGLEVQRAKVLSDIATQEKEREDLERAQGDLSRLAAEVVSIEVLGESEVRQSSSLVQRIPLAVLAALVVAAILTFVRGAIGKKPRA